MQGLQHARHSSLTLNEKFYTTPYHPPCLFVWHRRGRSVPFDYETQYQHVTLAHLVPAQQTLRPI